MNHKTNCLNFSQKSGLHLNVIFDYNFRKIEYFCYNGKIIESLNFRLGPIFFLKFSGGTRYAEGTRGGSDSTTNLDP